MNEFWNLMEQETNKTTTENGAGALKSTMNACVDAFGRLGAMKKSPEPAIIGVFSKAFAEDRETAMRILFYMRDVRGGQGMRRVFRVCLKWLAHYYPWLVINQLDNILFFGRGDDYLCLLDEGAVAGEVSAWLCNQLVHDWMLYCKGMTPEMTLLAKWMPSCNTSSAATRAYARRLIKDWGWSEREYRTRLSKMRAALKVVETQISAKRWKEVNYAAVPSRANLKYQKAFVKHDVNRYIDHLVAAAAGEAKINAAALFPVDVVHKAWLGYNNPVARKLSDALWQSLPNYLEGRDETGLCVVDTSGSMMGEPMEVALSLGLYCADKCRGPFHGKFITFSNTPVLQTIRGNDLSEKLINMSRADWAGSTNIQAVFDLILYTAMAHDTPQEDMPKKLYIISDMQFNPYWGEDAEISRRDMNRWCALPQRNVTAPFMSKIRAKFAAAGYEMPALVYWNVRDSHAGMFQQTVGGENCCMVSGYSPSLFKAVIDGTEVETTTTITADKNGKLQATTTTKQVLSPLEVMRAAVYNERYDRVKWQ